MKTLWKIGLPIFIVHVLYIIFSPAPLTWFDSAIYDATAWNFSQGLGFSYTPDIPDALREPGYSFFFLSPIYFIFGHSILAAQLFQALLTTMSCLIMYCMGARYINRSVGMIAALMYGLYPPVIVYSGEILTEMAFTFLFILFCYVFLRTLEHKTWLWFLCCGLVLGVATLTRFVTIFVPILAGFIILWRLWPYWKQAVISWIIMTSAFAVVVSPWLIRNYLVFDSFILGRTGGSEIYWTGSYIPWDGDWQGYQWPLTDLVKDSTLSVTERDTAINHMTVENVKSNPIGVAWIWLKKPLKIYLQPEGFNTLLQLGAFQGNTFFTSLAIIAFIGQQIVWLFIFLGCLAYRRYSLFFTVSLPLVGYFILIHLPLNAVPRYAIPVYTVLFLILAIGLQDSISFVRQRLFKPGIKPMLKHE